MQTRPLSLQVEIHSTMITYQIDVMVECEVYKAPGINTNNYRSIEVTISRRQIQVIYTPPVPPNLTSTETMRVLHKYI